MSIDPKYYTEDVKTISKIEFSIFTNQEVKSYSAVSNDPFGINLPESYENYEPKKGDIQHTKSMSLFEMKPTKSKTKKSLVSFHTICLRFLDKAKHQLENMEFS
jgi:hypothetical protein